ncbi:hypothetical protein Q8A64_17045 [Oxalobacteraceae bacterium R-40]|uniref:Uncharacterized protein n=1 Tax=Keguizhuia sedimenti TaxID=3064264 RepID=A0ABU1BSW9_9BURK|nr:hypothetical protein [Oxalobacteraceae bacterium R-40]
MIASLFTSSFLKLFSGPIIWAIHFLFIYSFNGIMCARPALRREWVGLSLSGWAIVLASVMALLAIVLINLREWRSDMDASNRDFARWMTVGLGVLSAFAIILEAIPVFLVPDCA